MSTKNKKSSTTTTTVKTQSERKESQEPLTPTVKNKAILNSPEDYSPSSQIAKAYNAGYFPSFTHQKLFHALLNELNNKSEGDIDFNQVLSKTKMHRSSALQIIRHMSNFGIIEVSFNSSHVIGEPRKSWVFVKILKNLEVPTETEIIPKSA